MCWTNPSARITLLSTQIDALKQALDQFNRAPRVTLAEVRAQISQAKQILVLCDQARHPFAAQVRPEIERALESLRGRAERLTAGLRPHYAWSAA